MLPEQDKETDQSLPEENTGPKPFNPLGAEHQLAPTDTVPTTAPGDEDGRVEANSFGGVPVVNSFAPEPVSEAVSADTPAPSPVLSAPVASAPVEQPRGSGGNISDLTLYLIVLFSGLSTIASASYMVWTALDYFLSEPEDFSLFDFSTFNIYVLIYLVLFGLLNVLASLRLEKRVKEQGATYGTERTIGAIWRALLVVWGVAALVGILYSPLSASLDSGDSVGNQIAIDITSAVFAILLIAAFFWRDMLLHKVRSAFVPTAIVAAIVLGTAGVAAFTTLNPKQAKKEETPSSMYDYSSDYDFSEESSYSSELDHSHDE